MPGDFGFQENIVYFVADEVAVHVRGNERLIARVQTCQPSRKSFSDSSVCLAFSAVAFCIFLLRNGFVFLIGSGGKVDPLGAVSVIA